VGKKKQSTKILPSPYKSDKAFNFNIEPVTIKDEHSQEYSHTLQDIRQESAEINIQREMT